MHFITEEQVEKTLTWDGAFQAVEQALLAVSAGHTSLPPRTITEVADSDKVMITMSGCLDDPKFGALGCKVFTVFPGNASKKPPLPTESFYFMLMDVETGTLKAVLSAERITRFRTVATSAVATKYLHPKDNKVLAIVGTGTLGKLHVEAFQHLFNFQEVRLWNRTIQRAHEVVKDFRQRTDINGTFVVCNSVEECVNNADVVVCATLATEVLVKSVWLKKGAHVNAIGVNPDIQELDDETYKNSIVYVDNINFAKQQLKRLLKMGVKFQSEVGALISGLEKPPSSDKVTVFQSLGVVAEDCAVARLVYDKLWNH